jgi:hypothetical protein
MFSVVANRNEHIKYNVQSVFQEEFGVKQCALYFCKYGTFLIHKTVLLDFVNYLNYKNMKTTFRKLDSASVFCLRPGPSPGLRHAQPGGPTDRISVLFPLFLPEDRSRIQLLKRCSFQNFII